MPITSPFGITVQAYGTDGSAVFASANIIIMDVTTQETLTGTTDALGRAQFDLGNLTSGYSDNDPIHALVYKNGVSGGDRYILELSDGDHDFTIYCDDIPQFTSTKSLININAKSAATAGIVRIYDNHHSRLIGICSPPANQTRTEFFGEVGKLCTGGLCIVKSRGDMEVTVRVH